MSRPFIAQEPVFVNASMTSTVHSLPTNIKQMPYVSYDLSWTGSPTGTFTVEVSDTYQQSGEGVVINAGNWTALTLSTTVTASGSAGSAFIDVRGTAATWIRLTYTPSSGTGTLNASMSAKVL
jgi:hypothetical protein